MTKTKEIAISYVRAGLHVIPVKADGSKRPLICWAEYQARQPTEAEVESWCGGPKERGVAILGGNGLEILDVEDEGTFEALRDTVAQQAPDLLARLSQVQTPGKHGQPGRHLYYRCAVVEGNKKLASDEQGQTLIETRGKGGYVVAPGSPASCHRAGKEYVHVEGPPLTDIQEISPEERQILFDAASTLHRGRAARPQRSRTSGHQPGRPSKRDGRLAKQVTQEAPVTPGPLLPLEQCVRLGQRAVEEAPLARSGQGGHNTTFRLARVLRNDLVLPDEVGRPLLDRYNEMLGEAGEEIWTKNQLDHKWDSAGGDNPDYPRGRAALANPAPAKDPHRLAGEFMHQRRWVVWNNTYFQYDGCRYRDVSEGELRALLNKHARAQLDADYQRQREQAISAESSRLPDWPTVTTTLVHNILQALASLALQPSNTPMPSYLSRGDHADLLAVANGLLDLNTLEMGSHTPDWFSTACLPYDYDPEATCPRWEQMLQQNLENDAERIALVQEFFGYTLVPTTDAQKCLCLVGDGGNGKSAVLAGLHALLGQDNVSTVPLEGFAQRFAMAQTLGKLANIAAEVGELDRTAEGTLKAFVSGDPMPFERKGRDGFTARPTARLVLATNNLPRFSDKNEGIWRRICYVPFNRRVPQAERVPGMDKAEWWLRQGEVPGILNWALEGLKRLRGQQMQFTEPEASRAALEAHRKDSDPAREFLLEHYVPDENAAPLPTAEVYQAYKSWCEEHGQKYPLTAQSFGKQVRRVFGLGESQTKRCAGKVQKAWLGLAKRPFSVT